jgi:hypothetical protein
MLAHGTQSPIPSEVKVGVIVQLHLKRRHKNVTHPITKAQKANTEICIKRTTVSKKQNGTVPKGICSGVEHQKHEQLYQLSNHYSYDSVR